MINALIGDIVSIEEGTFSCDVGISSTRFQFPARLLVLSAISLLRLVGV